MVGDGSSDQGRHGINFSGFWSTVIMDCRVRTSLRSACLLCPSALAPIHAGQVMVDSYRTVGSGLFCCGFLLVEYFLVPFSVRYGDC